MELHTSAFMPRRLSPVRARVISLISKGKWPLGLLAVAGTIAITSQLLPGKWGLAPGGVFEATLERELRDAEGNVIRDAQGEPRTEIEKITIQDGGKSVWDVLNLAGVLAVPILLAVLGFSFQRTQQEQARQFAEEQRKQAVDEAREEVLQLYLDRMSALLVDKNLMAIAAKPAPEEMLEGNLRNIAKTKEKTPEEEALLNTALKLVHTRPDSKSLQRTPDQQELLDASLDVMRARTLSILRRFEDDVERKSSVVRFLAEAEIATKLKLNLREAYLSFAHLEGAHLERAHLERAYLSFAHLEGANLGGAYLEGAYLEGANLEGANIERANIERANLRGAYLEGANLEGAYLSFANLKGANIERANLRRAYLSFANLEGANLKGANIEDADLSKAKLCNTKLPQGSTLDPNRDCDSYALPLD